ncbi:MAG: BON domain-containing protein, partial [Planctomycetota bacterium]|nr:BON domain-containing protein [Planctomycetota bacterium]
VIRQRLGEIVEDVEEAVADTVLTARVRGVLLQDPDIPSLVIGVASRQGDVTLTGKVREIEHIQRALELTLAVPGVKRVRSRLILLEAGPPPKPPGATEQKK